MQPVGAEGWGTGTVDETAGTGASGRIVLPRFLRRPARALERLQWRLPPHLGLKGLVLLFLATAITGVFIGGHGVTVVSAVTASSGLAIENVRITGQSETSEVDVLDRLAISKFPSLLTFDVDAARARVEALPWVRQATLTKLYPDTLELALVERTPFAIWQHDSVVSLVDGAGVVIVDRVGERYSGLPLVVGLGAAGRATEFVALVGEFPAIAKRVRAGVLVSERRWTVVLDNGIELHLPANDPAAALAGVEVLDAEKAVLSREIAALDFRIPGRMVVRLTDAGVAARNALLKEREKLAKRGRTNT